MMNPMDELEMSVIGAILLSEDRGHLEACFSGLSAECFTISELGALFADGKAQFSEMGKVDAILSLKSLGQEYKAIMKACMELVPAPSLLPQYSLKLFDGYRKRLLAAEIERIQEDIMLNAPLKDILGAAENALAVQRKLDEVQGSATSLEFFDAIIEFINSLSVKNTAHKTGIRLLDYVLGGFMPKSVTVLAGRSGMGKTDMALFLATRLAVSGVRVLYLTMEMPAAEIMGRIASRVALIDSTRIRDKMLSGEELGKIHMALDKISKIPLIFDEQQNLSVMDIAAKIKKHKPDVVFIDHLGLMALDKYKKRWESIADNSVALKKLAMQTGVAMVELVQQTSEVEKCKEKTANLSDLKGSDGIGNDADVVLFIRTEKSGAGSVLSGNESYPAFLQIEKNRNGKTGTLGFQWKPQFHSYSLVENREEN